MPRGNTRGISLICAVHAGYEGLTDFLVLPEVRIYTCCMKFVLAFLLVGLSALPVIYSQSYVPAAQADARSVRTERVRTPVSFPFAPAATSSTAVSKSTQKPAQAATVTTKPATVAAPAPKAAAQPAPKPVPKPVAQSSEPAPTVAASALASASFAQEVEQEILRLINRERAKEGLGTVAVDANLSAIARAHSKDMLSKSYFSHTNTAGCGSSCRITAAGYAWRAVGENIYTMSGFDLSAKETARKMVDAWMDSPGHRANVLNGTFTNQGIGLAVSGKTIYATSLFSLPL